MGRRIDRVDEWMKDTVSTLDYQILSAAEDFWPSKEDWKDEYMRGRVHSRLRHELMNYADEIHLAIVSRPILEQVEVNGVPRLMLWAIALSQYNGFQPETYYHKGQ